MSKLISGLERAKLDAYNLPYDLPISTATITCKINVLFDVENIAYYFNDFDDILIDKKYGNRSGMKSVNSKKKKQKKKKRKEKKDFFNQVSLIFCTPTLMGLDINKLSQKEKEKTVNVKLFINGSIHMTGCKHLSNITKCLEILFDRLKKTKAIINNEFKFEKKNFLKCVDDLDFEIINFKYDLSKYKENPYTHLNISNVYMFVINMINSNFNVGFKIKRDELRHLLIENGFDATLDPNVHACVNIKLNIPNQNKTISIFVFESGSITIAGSDSCEQILYAYNFINKFILTHYKILLSKQITPQLLIQLAKNIKLSHV
jgi:TATA-box binding protein (TBP) (component of TFIID and TFIIIB)